MSEPIKFKESNKNLLKPSGMTDEECKSLPVYSDGEQCISCWKMSWRERFSALFIGKIWLAVHSGQTQPPTWVGATSKYFKCVGEE